MGTAVGSGNFGFSNKLELFPPFPANAADNGLSVDAVTGRIVLGDDPGGVLSSLINNREIPLNGFNISLTDSGDSTVFNAAQIDLNEGGGNNLMTAFVDASQVFLLLQGIANLTDAPRITLDPNNGATASIQNHSDNFIITQGQGSLNPPFLFLNLLGGPYTFGDRTGAFTGSMMDLDTGNGLAAIDIGIVTAGRALELNPGVSGTRPESYSIGDLDALANGIFMQLDDAANVIRLGNTGMNVGININGSAGFTGTVNPITSITVVNGIVTAAA